MDNVENEVIICSAYHDLTNGSIKMFVPECGFIIFENMEKWTEADIERETKEKFRIVADIAIDWMD